MRQNPHWRTTYTPMALHGDAVPVIKVGKAGTKSFDVTTNSALMAIGHTKIIKLFISWLFAKCKVSPTKGSVNSQRIIHDDASTTWHIWRVVMWSLRVAFLGIWPTCDADGKAYEPNSIEGRKAGTPLADGLRLAMHCLKGDLDHVAKSCELRHYDSKWPCQ